MSISSAHARDMHVYHLHFLSVTFLFEVKVCKIMRKEIISSVNTCVHREGVVFWLWFLQLGSSFNL